MRRVLLPVALGVIGLIAVLHAEPPTKVSPQPPAQVPAAKAVVTSLPTPLPATLFQGRVREAYSAAAEIPDVLAGVTCYCGCDKSLGHRSLLDCFVDKHGAT